MMDAIDRVFIGLILFLLAIWILALSVRIDGIDKAILEGKRQAAETTQRSSCPGSMPSRNDAVNQGS